MADNRPRSRERNVTGAGNGVHRRGDGLGTGPVGQGRGSSSAGGGGPKRAGGGMGPMGIIIALVVMLMGGGGALFGGGGSDSGTSTNPFNEQQTTQQTQQQASQSNVPLFNTPVNNPFMNTQAEVQNSSNSYQSDNGSDADTTVAKGARSKFTKLKGKGKDTTTIMLYMCGTDLESRSGMATSDLQEILKADLGSNIEILVYTGGCSRWKNNVISNQTNQIYRVKDGGLQRLESDLGNKPMTDPANLTYFIKYCKDKYPADRMDLILWDHGGGTVSGYGYDEKFQRSGAMSLAGINKALKDAKVKFDFIGFDACLMATTENALMLTKYADYLIASEETEPGVGWYYTDWLNNYAKDPSRATVTIGKDIIDSFVRVCDAKCRGQQTTLSIVDLAELEATLPDALTAFSKDTVEMIEDKDYKKLATARANTREFASSQKIDQIDLIDLANNLKTDSAKKLIKVLDSAIKYNKTSSNMTRAYGLSIYFPSKRLSYVKSAVSNYEAIGMNEEYTKAIQEYASLSASGQVSAQGSGNSSNPYGSLSGQTVSGPASGDLLSTLLSGMLTGGSSSSSSSGSIDADLINTLGYLLGGSGRSMPMEDTVDFITDNQFDATALTFGVNDKNEPVIALSEDQWGLVTDIAMSMYYDDGEGYVDMGLDNLYDFDEYGSLVAATDKNWLSINNQPVAYYYQSTVDDGENYCITGYVPAMLNGERVKLMITFDQDNPKGYIAGARTDYHDGETETQAKALLELNEGDSLDFLCDFYDYNGVYQDSYYLGETMTVTSDMVISDTYLGDGDINIMYRFTDIYGNEYWSEVLK